MDNIVLLDSHDKEELKRDIATCDKKIRDIYASNVRAPKVGDNGNWFNWDYTIDEWVDSGVPADVLVFYIPYYFDPTEEQVEEVYKIMSKIMVATDAYSVYVAIEDNLFPAVIDKVDVDIMEVIVTDTANMVKGEIDSPRLFKIRLEGDDVDFLEEAIFTDKISEKEPNRVPTVAAVINYVKSGGMGSEVLDDIETLKEQMEELLYKPIDITSFTCNPSGIMELGTVVTKVVLNWAVNRVPTTASINSTPVVETSVSKTIEGVEYKTSKSWKLYVSDGKSHDEASAGFTMYNGVYYGVVKEGTEITRDILLNMKKTLQGSRGITFRVNAGPGEKILFACPSRFDKNSNPYFTIGGFDYDWDLEAKDASFENKSGYEEDYDIWLSGKAGLGDTTVKVSQN